MYHHHLLNIHIMWFFKILATFYVDGANSNGWDKLMYLHLNLLGIISQWQWKTNCIDIPFIITIIQNTIQNQLTLDIIFFLSNPELRKKTYQSKRQSCHVEMFSRLFTLKVKGKYKLCTQEHYSWIIQYNT